jgi:hypothetical protein
MKRVRDPHNDGNERHRKRSKLGDDRAELSEEGNPERPSQELAADDEAFDLSSYIATLPNKNFALPHIIMSIALESDQDLDSGAFAQWMKDFPALAKFAKIQGVYRGYSTLVVAAVPCFHLGYVTRESSV